MGVVKELTERQRVIVALIKKDVADNVALNVAVNIKYLSEKLNVNRNICNILRAAYKIEKRQ